jgi:two-component system sensor histidine kinase RegB
MDAPLLALTRPSAGGSSGRSPKDAAVENMRQLIQLRWMAVVGQLIAILGAHYGLGVPLLVAPMLGVVALLALANLLFAVTVRRSWVIEGELFIALLLDMAALTAQLYLSGGTANPFVWLYLLQIVLGAILLTPALAWVLVGASTLFYAFLTVERRPLLLPRAVGDLPIDLRAVGEWISLAMVAGLLVLFITRISRNLRARDAYVADLAQRAAEEDGIVRMGLFASGAAHELGTPLSSLSVLVSDWQRDTKLVRNGGFQEDLTDAKTAIDRCKAIVSNILHAAGQSRGEAMTSTKVDALLDEIARSWRSINATSLAYDASELRGATVAAEPALRQAIWSLLENAAAASPAGIELTGSVDGERVLILVSDRGPGFPEDQLQSIGKLYQSDKGPGRGLGLFLASNIARRLGGFLEAENRADGGAMVRLVLPLVQAAEEQE